MRAGQAGNLLGHLGSGAALSHKVNDMAGEDLQGGGEQVRTEKRLSQSQLKPL